MYSLQYPDTLPKSEEFAKLFSSDLNLDWDLIKSVHSHNLSVIDR